MNHAEVRRRQAGEISNLITLLAIWILGERMGENGITYMTAALGMCALLYALICGSLSDALGKLLRGRKNKGQYKNVKKMRRSAMIFQMILGFAGSLVLCLSAGRIAEGIFGLRYSTMIILAISPVIFLRTVSAVLQGCFQGEGSEVPTAAAGILRAVFMLGFGFLFSGMLGDYGDKAGKLLHQDNFAAMYRGIGTAIGISLAEVFVVLFLFFIYKAGGFAAGKNRQEGMYSTDSTFECIRYLCGSRWIQALTAFLGGLPLVLGLFFFCRGAEDPETAVLDYSIYAGDYLVLCGMLGCILMTFALPVIARIFSSLRKSEHRFARTAFQSGMHICLVHGIYFSVFLAVMGEQIGKILCPEREEIILPMLRGGSFLVALGVLACYFARFLQTAGKKMQVLTAAGIADVLFVIMVLVTGKAGILSLVYGSITGAFVFCVILGMFACGLMRARINWLEMLAVPCGAGAAAGLVCMMFDRLLGPHMNGPVTLLLAFVITDALYWVVLILLRNFKDYELDVIPGGRLIGVLKQMLHVRL